MAFPRFLFIFSFYFKERNPVVSSYANSVNPDQTPCVAAADLGLHCLPMSFLCGTRFMG